MPTASHTTSSPNVLLHRDTGVYIISFFDAPVFEDTQLLVRELEDFLERGVVVSGVVDIRGLREINPGPYLNVTEPLTRARDRVCSLVRAAAVLHSGGLAAASIAGGISMIIGNAFPVELFTEVEEAFNYLGLPKQETLDCEKRIAEFRAIPNLVLRCRAYLSEHLVSVSLATCAEHLGVCEAELQREFSVFGTNFRNELRSARIETAKSLLDNTTTTTARIGEQVGYRKQQNFTDAFRSATGMTPGAWRKMRAAEP